MSWLIKRRKTPAITDSRLRQLCRVSSCVVAICNKQYSCQLAFAIMQYFSVMDTALGTSVIDWSTTGEVRPHILQLSLAYPWRWHRPCSVWRSSRKVFAAAGQVKKLPSRFEKAITRESPRGFSQRHHTGSNLAQSQYVPHGPPCLGLSQATRVRYASARRENSPGAVWPDQIGSLRCGAPEGLLYLSRAPNGAGPTKTSLQRILPHSGYVARLTWGQHPAYRCTQKLRPKIKGQPEPEAHRPTSPSVGLLW